jgi:hypothetical protein
MADDSESASLMTLWVVTAVCAITFVGFEIAALDHEPVIALFGLGGVCVGGLIASVIHLSRRRRETRRPIEVLDAVEALAQQMRTYELGQERIAELEDRLDFAERLLSRGSEADRLDAQRIAQ